MRRRVLAVMAVLTVCGPGSAAQWFPPRPGQSNCSGWDDQAARDACQVKEDRQRDENAHNRQREEDRRAAAFGFGGGGADLGALRAANAERYRQEMAQAKAHQEAWDAQQARQRADYEARQAAFARAEEADEFKRKDAADAFVAPEAFVGQKIKLGGMFCYAPREDDVRCWTPEAEVVVSASSIEPPEARTALHQQCGSIRATSTTACLRVLRFVMSSFRRDREGDGTERVVITPSTVTVVQ